MSDPGMVCQDEQRRDKVRAAALHGLDYLEVSEDQLSLMVVFLGKAPESIKRENVRIDGGRRITGIEVTEDPEVQHPADPEADDWMTVRVNKTGDFSTYTLRLVDAGTNTPMCDFDVRYSSLDFSFKAGCSSELDCAAQPVCPVPAGVTPEISYLAKDYGSFRQLILDRLALIMPGWQEQHAADIGIMLVEVLAYVGDQLSYYQDAVATEAYLNTARQRISVRRHVRLVDYRMHEGCNARVWVYIQASDPVTLQRGNFYFATRIPNAAFSDRSVLLAGDLVGVDWSAVEVFQPMECEVKLDPARNEIHFYTWGDGECCLAAGATSATLLGTVDALGLKADDFLLLEEVIGPKTGRAADSDKSHRQIVRLTGVQGGCDPLTRQEVVEVTWAREDAPAFALCLSAIGPAPDCKLIENISVARGNIVLADHGRTLPGLDVSHVPCVDVAPVCRGLENPSDPLQKAGPYGPKLLAGPLTFTQALPAKGPASSLLRQDPAKALPSIDLESKPGGAWTPQADLLASGGADRNYVIEVDDDGVAHLRFGDGDLGRQPQAGATFTANYRVGIGGAGHIGGESIAHIVFQHGYISGVALQPRNPLPASGGIDPEPIENVKQIAPYAFKNVFKRAITTSDYAAVASNPYEPDVRQAEARFLWNGSWYEAAVAIDPFAAVPAGDDAALAGKVQRDLFRYRRIGQDIRVRLAEFVPVDLQLSVCVKRDYQRGHVKAALLDLLSNRLGPGGAPGFFYSDNLGLGQGLVVSKIIAAVQSVSGVEDVQVKALLRKFDPPELAITSGVLTVKPWQMVRLDNDPSFPENGTLSIDLRGGR